MLQTAHASASFGTACDHWSSITAEVAEPGKGAAKLFAEITSFEFNRAMREDARYLEAITVTNLGVAAWWVYGEKVRATPLTDEREFEIKANAMSEEMDKLRYLSAYTKIRPSRPGEYVAQSWDYVLYARRMVRAAQESSSVTSTVTVHPPVSHQISFEEITFSDSAIEHTRHRPQGTVSVFFYGRFVSAASGLPLVLHQNEPGVFSLSEPGYGMLIVSYLTSRQLVSVNYDLWTSAMTPAQREEIARETILCGWPEDNVPKIFVLVAREEAPEIQAMITAPRKAVVSQRDILRAPAPPEEPKLKEESRETESKTIKASNDPNQTVTFKRVKKVKLRDQNGKIWEMEFVNE